ncbi:MAG: hypothetical protein II951_01825 [Bacteroidales bacterium]|nr:hypothetical protein [Bacteroidales bacterium]
MESHAHTTAYVRLGNLLSPRRALFLYVVSILLVLLLSPLSASAQYSGGSGSSSNPYLIKTVADLQALATNCNSNHLYSGNSKTYFRLANDIVCNDNLLVYDADNHATGALAHSGLTHFSAIGTKSSPAYIDFDGAGHSISGFYISSTSDFQALFGYLKAGASVHDLSLVDSYVVSSGSGVAGIYAGSISNDLQGNITISNCLFDGYVSGASSVGGVTGRLYGTVTNCVNRGTVNGGTGMSVGGVCALASQTNSTPSKVINCVNYGNVTGGQGTAGIAGMNIAALVSGCINFGDVKGTTQVGGIAGECNDGSRESTRTVGNVNFGTILSTNAMAGGVCGFVHSSYVRTGQQVLANVNYGKVIAPTAGGIVGKQGYDDLWGEPGNVSKSDVAKVYVLHNLNLGDAQGSSYEGAVIGLSDLTTSNYNTYIVGNYYDKQFIARQTTRAIKGADYTGNAAAAFTKNLVGSAGSQILSSDFSFENITYPIPTAVSDMASASTPNSDVNQALVSAYNTLRAASAALLLAVDEESGRYDRWNSVSQQFTYCPTSSSLSWSEVGDTHVNFYNGTAILTQKGLALVRSTFCGSHYDRTLDIRDLTQATIVLDDFDDVIKCDPIEPPVKTVYLGATEVDVADYEVSYADNDVSGLASVIVSAKGGSNALYMGSVSKSFEIKDNRKSIAAAKITADFSDYVSYTKADQTSYLLQCHASLTPSVVSVKLGTTSLDWSDPDKFEVAYEDNDAVGTAKLVVKAKCQNETYGGKAVLEFPIILYVDLADATVSLGQTSFVAEAGEAVRPSVTVTLPDGTVVSPSDYSVSYSDNVLDSESQSTVGKVSITALPKSPACMAVYTGSVEKSFTINKLPASEGHIIVADIDDIEYDGCAHKLGFSDLSIYNNNTSSKFTDPYKYKRNSNSTYSKLGDAFIYAYGPSDDFTNVGVKYLTLTNPAVTNDFYYYFNNKATPTNVNLGSFSVSKSYKIVPYDISGAPSSSSSTSVKYFGESASRPYKFVVCLSSSSFSATYSGQEISPSVISSVKFYNADNSPVTLVPDVDYSVSYVNNVNAGDAYVTITGHGNFDSTTDAVFSFHIDPVNIEDLSFSLSVPYQGYELRPELPLSFNGTPLVKDVDYTIENWSDNTDAGTAHVTVKGIGNFSGTKSFDFTISPRDITTETSLASASSDLFNSSYVFCGSQIKPKASADFVFTNDKAVDYTLVEGTDFSYSYGTNLNCDAASSSEGSISITGTGNFTGSLSFYFDIAQVDIAIATIPLIPDQTYSGLALTPSLPEGTFVSLPTADGVVHLVEGTDFSVSYSDNVEVGDNARFIITALPDGNYKGSNYRRFNILPAPFIARLSGYDAVAESDTVFFYTGSPILPAVSASFLVNGVEHPLSSSDFSVSYDDSPLNASSSFYDVTVTGLGNFAGRVCKLHYKILPAVISVSIDDIPDQTFTGSSITPDLSVYRTDVNPAVLLTPNADYTVSFSDNVEVGTATATITLSSNFTTSSSLSKSFTIKAAKVVASLSSAVFTYNGCSQRPSLSVSLGDVVFSLGTDYSVSYRFSKSDDYALSSPTSESVHSGYYWVDVVMLNSNYSLDKSSLAYHIVQATPAFHELSESSFVFNGTRQVPSSLRLYSLDCNDEKLYVPSSELSVSWPADDESVFADTYYLPYVVSGSGDHIATSCDDCASYTITPSSDFSVSLSQSSFVYNGLQQTPDVIVKIDDVVLPSSLYSVSYDKAVRSDVGSYSVTVTGDGVNIVGEKSLSYSITPLPLSVSFADVKKQFVYDALPHCQTPSVSISGSESLLAEGSDYEVVYSYLRGSSPTSDFTNVGSISLTSTIVLKNENFSLSGSDSREQSYSIVPDEIASVSLVSSSMAFDGNTHQPVIFVVLSKSGIALSSSDFSPSIPSCRDVQSYTVSVQAVGSNYVGSATTVFSITPATIGRIALEYDKTPYDGSRKMPSVTVYDADDNVVSSGFSVSYGTNVDCPSGSVSVSADNANLFGSASASFEISPLPLSSISTVSSVDYDGTAKTPSVVVMSGDLVLTLDQDFSLSFEDNISAGTATVTATGINNFSGSLSTSFSINALSLSASNSSASTVSASRIYDGAEHPVDISVFYSFDGADPVALSSSDFSLSPSALTDAGDYEVVVTGKNNFKDSRTVSYSVEKADIRRSAVAGVNTEYIYAGHQIAPVPVVNYPSIGRLSEGVDYELILGDNTELGTGFVTIKGINNFKEEMTLRFSIVPAKPVIALSPTSFLFNGAVQQPSFSVSYQDVPLDDDDYVVSPLPESILVGDYDVTVTGKNGYDGMSDTKSYSILKSTILSVELLPEVYIYDGTPKCPSSVKVFNEVNNDLMLSGFSLSCSNNVNASSEALLTVTGDDVNLAGSKSLQFSILPRDITEVSVDAIPSQSFTGSPVEPSISLSFNELTLSLGTDFSVEYSSNTDVGTAHVAITGLGNFTGFRDDVSFEITPPSISSAVIAEIPSCIYDATEQRPSLSVSLDGVELVLDTDFSVAYEDNVNAGTARVIISGMGNYSGSAEASFVINPRDISDLSDPLFASSPIPAELYDGKSHTPSVSLSFRGSLLSEGDDADFSVIYADNVNAGIDAGQVSLFGHGNFSGSRTLYFDITPYELVPENVESLPSVTYTSFAFSPEPVVYFGSTTLRRDVDYVVDYPGDHVNAATAYVHISGIGNFSGDFSVPYVINKASISGDNAVIAKVGPRLFTGSEIRPEPPVTYVANPSPLPQVSLRKDVDFVYSYSDNVESGTATLTVSATEDGNFTGSQSISFLISTAKIVAAIFSPIPDQTFANRPLTPPFTLTYEDEALVPDVDYTYSYEDNFNAGVATILVTGIGRFADKDGYTSTSFNILPRPLSDDMLSPLADTVFSGAPVTFVPELFFEDYRLVMATDDAPNDFPVSFSDNTFAFEHPTLTISGNGNFSGTIVSSFSILPASISDADAAYIPGLPFTGEPATPPVALSYNDVYSLVPDVDYSLEYIDNVNSGLATIRVTASPDGNFVGVRELHFAIGVVDISTATFSPIASQTFSSYPLTPEFSLTCDGRTLVPGVDYDAVYSDNVNVGTATISVSGKGDYVGSVSTYFSIIPALLTDDIAFADSVFVYDGSPKIPSIEYVRVGDLSLVPDVDFSVSFENNVNAGTASATFVGLGNFAGSVSVAFDISPAPLDAEFDLEYYKAPYDGTPKEPAALNVFRHGFPLVPDVDFSVSYLDNVEPRSIAFVILTGKGNYQGKVSKTFFVEPVELNVWISLDNYEFVYDGSEKRPAVSVFLESDSTLLTNGVEYSVRYVNNVDAGMATAIVSGYGFYDMTEYMDYKIVRAPFDVDVTLEYDSVVYDFSARKPSFSVSHNGRTLTPGKDFSFFYANNSSVGTAALCLTGMGNFKDETVEKFFEILPVHLTPDDVSLEYDEILYDGTRKRPAVSVVVDDRVLTDSVDYVLNYVGDSSASQASVEVTGIGVYDGSVVKNYTILPHDFMAQVSLEYYETTYDGSPKQPSVVATRDGFPLREGLHYVVSYLDNVNAGEAVAVVSAAGIYTGEVRVPFSINKAPLHVIADDVTMTDGYSVPTLTVSYDGFAPCDSAENALSSLPMLFVSDDPVIGVHTIHVAGGSAQNYDLSYHTGRLIVEEIGPFLIWPNPCHYRLFVRGIHENSPFTISSISGVEMMSGYVSGGSFIDVSPLPAGIFFICVDGHKQLFVRHK